MLKEFNCLLIGENSLMERDFLETTLSKINSINVHTTCKTSLGAAAILKEKDFDIVFCDIDIPNLNGIELLKELQRPPIFVFIGSNIERAAENYELNVIDFIEKPVNLERLVKATNKAIEAIELKKSSFPKDKKANPLTVSDKQSQKIKKDYFFIKKDSDFVRIDHVNVLFLESMGNFSTIHIIKNEKHITLINLKNIEEQLPATQFMRVHRQYIINLDHILSLSHDGNIHLREGHVIPLGSLYKAGLMRIINQNLLVR